MNQIRKNIILQVFLQCDKSNTITIRIDHFKEQFNPNRHPDVIENLKTSNEVLNDWLNNIDAFCNYYSKFYSQISFCIKEDRSLEYMIRNVWNIAKKHGGKRKRLFWV